MESDETKKFSSFAKRVLANAAEELEPYEKPDVFNEFLWIVFAGKLPTSYKIVRTLAVASWILKRITRER